MGATSSAEIAREAADIILTDANIECIVPIMAEARLFHQPIAFFRFFLFFSDSFVLHGSSVVVFAPLFILRPFWFFFLDRVSFLCCVSFLLARGFENHHRHFTNPPPPPPPNHHHKLRAGASSTRCAPRARTSSRTWAPKYSPRSRPRCWASPPA